METLKNLEDKYQFKNIRFMGQLSNTEVLEQIKNSKAVITATKMEEGQPRILNEASILGVPSIFPDFWGMSEYFPKNYFLSFEQYNYQDLIMKLQKLTEKDELLNISNEILAYSNKILDYDVLIEEFEKNFKMISVLMCSYNNGSSIQDSIESILNQELHKF